MMRQGVLFITAIFVGVLGGQRPAHAQTALPKAPVKTQGDGAEAWLARKIVVDVDAALKKQGLDPAVCTFHQITPVQDFSYRGIEGCLVKDFNVSMRTSALAGTIYAWIPDAKGNYQAIELQWRPPQGGWSVVISELLEMKNESARYEKRLQQSGPVEANKLRFKEFLGGDLKIIVPDHSEVLAGIASKGGAWLQNYLDKVSEIDLHLKPTSVQNGQVIYDGDLVIDHSNIGNSTGDFSPQATTIHLHTNVNIVLLSRVFFFQGGASTANFPEQMDLMPMPETLP